MVRQAIRNDRYTPQRKTAYLSPHLCFLVTLPPSFVSLSPEDTNCCPKSQNVRMPRKEIPPVIDDNSEREMIESFIRGETAGFKFVYARFRQRVFSYCLYYMGDQMLAEDAFQEVFSRVYTHRDQLRETKALKSWLLLITRSVCLNSLRTSKFTPEFVSISKTDEPDNLGDTVEQSVHPLDTLVADDMLRVALARIAPIYREAFLLREFEGYEYDEIARKTETTEMNVKVRITRAKKQLRVLLTPYYKYEAEQSKKRGRTRQAEPEEISESSTNGGELNDLDISPSAEEIYAL